jgi:hypothetical protein
MLHCFAHSSLLIPSWIFDLCKTIFPKETEIIQNHATTYLDEGILFACIAVCACLDSVDGASHKLTFDFYLPHYNLLIDYHGTVHCSYSPNLIFKLWNIFTKSFRDLVQAAPLVTISYWKRKKLDFVIQSNQGVAAISKEKVVLSFSWIAFLFMYFSNFFYSDSQYAMPGFRTGGTCSLRRSWPRSMRAACTFPSLRRWPPSCAKTRPPSRPRRRPSCTIRIGCDGLVPIVLNLLCFDFRFCFVKNSVAHN